jgi:hypothetical protein
MELIHYIYQNKKGITIKKFSRQSDRLFLPRKDEYVEIENYNGQVIKITHNLFIPCVIILIEIE